MICSLCKRAGGSNRIANSASPDTDTRQWHRMYAVEAHQDCEHPGTCPCQHVVGLVVVPVLPGG